MKSFWAIVFITLSFSLYGATFFKGKTVMDRSYKINVLRVDWGMNSGDNRTDKIQILLSLYQTDPKSIPDFPSPLILVFERLDSNGESLGAYEVTISRRYFELLYNYSYSSYDSRGRNLSKTVNRENWYAYTTFPRDTETRKLRLVNILWDGREEVNYIMKGVSNDIIRNNMMPNSKNMHSATLSESSHWVPENNTPTSVNSQETLPGGNENSHGRTWNNKMSRKTFLGTFERVAGPTVFIQSQGRSMPVSYTVLSQADCAHIGRQLLPLSDKPPRGISDTPSFPENDSEVFAAEIIAPAYQELKLGSDFSKICDKSARSPFTVKEIAKNVMRLTPNGKPFHIGTVEKTAYNLDYIDCVVEKNKVVGLIFNSPVFSIEGDELPPELKNWYLFLGKGVIRRYGSPRTYSSIKSLTPDQLNTGKLTILSDFANYPYFARLALFQESEKQQARVVLIYAYLKETGLITPASLQSLEGPSSTSAEFHF